MSYQNQMNIVHVKINVSFVLFMIENNLLIQGVSRPVLLTGATGIVGSHIMYELLWQRLMGMCTGQIYVLVRPGLLDAGSRVERLLSTTMTPSFLHSFAVADMLRIITVIACDFTQEDPSRALSVIDEKEALYVIHAAASTNLSPGAAAIAENDTVNMQGSKRLLTACSHFCKRFVYISTAYSCGIRQGLISTDYSILENLLHRNPYEACKYETEVLLQSMCESNGVSLQILRPGVVVSRMIDEPLLFMPRYNVIFAYAAFFYSLVQKGEQVTIPIRVRPDATMHLVPLDYVAKSIARLYTDETIEVCNIVPEEGYLIKPLIEEMLSEVGYEEYYFTDDLQPADSSIARVYQTKVEASFGPYISDEPYRYDTRELQEIMHDVPLPHVPTHYRAMIAAAVKRQFISLL